MFFKLKKMLPIFFAFVLLLVSIWYVKQIKLSRMEQPKNESIIENIDEESSSNKIVPDTSNDESKKEDNIIITGEVKAIWIPYMSLDMKDTDRSEVAFKQKFDNIVKESKNFGANALIVQVRPFADAFYPSEIFPWSHFLTGTQGVDPGYDPLKYMIEATHGAGMQFHAWLNPFRIQSKDVPNTLSANNLYSIWRNNTDKNDNDFVIDFDECKYFNPAYMEVQAKIIEGVKEIIANYNVDGVQFDDYFYPTKDENFDKIAYQKYCSKMSENGRALTLEEWRKNNINTFVAGVYSAIKSENQNVEFGISPQCNIQNDLNMGADIYTWGSTKGYVDYICPQFYVNFEHPVLPFDKSVEEWQKIITNPNVKFYYGLALYKCGSDVDYGTWKNVNDIIKQEIEYGRNKGCDGFMFYSWEYLQSEQSKQEVLNASAILR